MKIIVHRGTKQIGGSVIELSTDNSRIILDIGQELPDLHAENNKGKVILPPVKGLYTGEKADIDAVFITHAHGDHIGLFPNINKDIPIYIGEKSCEIYNMTGRFTGSKSFIQATKFLEHTKPIIVGDFKIIPYLVDHSAYDAYAFVIYAEGKCVVYTGDIRDHGKKGILTKYFQKSIQLHPDALLMEGTLFGRIDEKLQTEDEIKEEASGVMSVTTGPVLVLQSSTNIDRLVAMYNAAKASDRLFIIDIFTANILSVIGGSVGSILKKARVIYPYHLTNKMFENNEKELMYKFSKMKIKVEELNENPNYCLLIRSSMLGILKNLKSFEEGILIYSMWQGYKERSDIKRMLDYVGQQNMEIKNLHTSGHGGISTLKNIVDSCKPKRIIPIHTEWPEKFQEVFEDVCLLKDGEELTIKMEVFIMNKNMDNILKELKKRCNNNSIKFTKDIDFNYDESNKTVNLFLNEGIRENMQKDGAAFEGWALALKANLPDLIDNVKLEWDEGKEPIEESGSSWRHFNRFLYRVDCFQNKYEEWFSVNTNSSSWEGRIQNAGWVYMMLNSPGDRKASEDIKKTDKLSEHELELYFTNEGSKGLRDALVNIHEVELDKIKNQLPVGLFVGEVSKGNYIFTGGKSAIDLYSTSKNGNFTIFELKGKNNEKVGIVSELFFYASLIKDVIDGKFKSDLPELKSINNNKVNAVFLAPKLHPLISDEVIKMLNNKDDEIEYMKLIYSITDDGLDFKK